MAGTIKLDILDRIAIASPCHVRWDDMQGDDRKRFCGECKLSVYNLSAMSRDEAAEIVTAAEGRFCAGFYRRADGTLLTRDCPVGLRRARAAAAAATRRIAAAIALVIGAGLMFGLGRQTTQRLRFVQPFATICEWLQPGSMPSQQQWIAGAICGPVPTAQPA
ncbi:MAG: hypothetical protein WD749_03145 [Phycisphaerales bacterium]